MTGLKKKLTNKNKRKVKWLRRKWGKERDQDVRMLDVREDEDEGELGNEFSSDPRLYGGVVVSEDEMKVLRLPPKFGVYRKVSETQCKIDVEEAVNKLRWNRIINEKKDGGQGEGSTEQGRTEEPLVFVDKETGKVNIKKLMPRDLLKPDLTF